MTVYEKIKNGEYENKLPYPPTPSKPKILSKKAIELTEEEIGQLVEVKAYYDEVCQEVKRQRQAHSQEEANIVKKFCSDLEEECGTKDHPKADKIWMLACEYGHSSGLNEIANYYEELSELIT